MPYLNGTQLADTYTHAWGFFWHCGDMDSASKGNVLMFVGAMLVLATFWMLLAALVEGTPVRLAIAALTAIGAIGVFRTYAIHMKRDSGQTETSED